MKSAVVVNAMGFVNGIDFLPLSRALKAKGGSAGFGGILGVGEQPQPRGHHPGFQTDEIFVGWEWPKSVGISPRNRERHRMDITMDGFPNVVGMPRQLTFLGRTTFPIGDRFLILRSTSNNEQLS